MKVLRLSALCNGCLYPQEIFLIQLMTRKKIVDICSHSDAAGDTARSRLCLAVFLRSLDEINLLELEFGI
jgi:riboflavin synthase